VEDVYHYHNFAYDIFRVESGVLTIIINGKMTKLRPGDWIIVEPGEKHRIGNQSSAQVVVQEVRLHVVDGDKLEAKNSYRKGS
jgi:mannose-1-phosphate guanylyltransferase